MKLLERVRHVAQRRRLAVASIECYQRWIEQFLLFHRAAAGQWAHPAKLGAAEVEILLRDIAVRRKLRLALG